MEVAFSAVLVVRIAGTFFFSFFDLRSPAQGIRGGKREKFGVSQPFISVIMSSHSGIIKEERTRVV